MKYQKKLNDETIQCEICPRFCKLKINQEGFCFARKNVNNKIISTKYGLTTGLAIDPIEKKPLYHFYPNSKVLSFGTLGCNMGCLFCQNWHLTKKDSNISFIEKPYTPKEIVDIAQKYNCKNIAFTYNDPVVFFEYAIDTAICAHKKNIKTILVSAGYINPKPREELFKYIDAANIDLKGFSEEFYQKNCLASLKPVLDTLIYIKENTNIHLEITTLLIEGENDDEKMLKNQCKWIVENLGKDTILHFSAYHPSYKFKKEKTSKNTLFKARQIALDEGLNYVYCGNIIDENSSTTYCKNCKKPIIKRNGFNVTEINLDNKNQCIYCKTKCIGEF